jgi:glycosyltransferase involved in cell wall biosynthesis
MDLAFINRMAGISRGGGEMWDLKMAEGLEELGADVTFYIGKPLRSELPDPIQKFDSVEIPTPHLRDLAYASPPGVGGALSDIDETIFCQRASQALSEQDHDLIQICTMPGFARYAERIDLPVSIVMHGEPYSLWHDVIKPWGSTYELLEAFDQVITVGGAREAIEKRLTNSVATINPGVDTEVFTPRNHIEPDKKQVLFVGRFVPVKNIELLINAFENIQRIHPSAELVLVGEGPQEDELKKRVEEQNLSETVQFMGYIPNDDLPKFYRNATVVALSSRSESYGITLLEAMSCGVPVVAPDIGVIPDIVDENENGLLYQRGSVAELTDALDEILSDIKLRRSYSQAARTKAVKYFDWSNKQTKLYDLYSNLTDSVSG